MDTIKSGWSNPWVRRFWIARRLLSKKVLRLAGPLNRWLAPKTKYDIKPGYHHAKSCLAFDDRPNTDEWQREVYQLAADIMNEKNFHSVLDLGCGSAYKLMHMLGGYETTGIELGPTVQWLQGKYPGHAWLPYEPARAGLLKTDLLICADVIEHVQDPDELLEYISRIDSRLILISTPERDGVAGSKDFGPPENPSHYREWNASEFKNYLSRWFLIEDQRIFNNQSVTQVITCKKHPQHESVPRA